MSKPPLTLQMPLPPDPVPVVLDPATTALLIFDVIEHISARQPKIKAQMLPVISSLLARARKAGVTVAYGTRAANMSTWLPEVAPASGDIKIENHAQDRFYNTDLDKALKAKGITTLILTGWKVSGSVTYTSVGATLRGYTVVVPVDTTSDATEYEIVIGQYQCGDINMWLLKEFAGTMRKADGDPVIFHYFMNNMFNNGLTETVIPFRVTSVVAARTMKALNYEIDFVYLDSAHECGETFLELSLYYDLLSPGGVLFGDDYSVFPAVKHDVDLFCKVHGCQLYFTGEGETWLIRKEAEQSKLGLEASAEPSAA